MFSCSSPFPDGRRGGRNAEEPLSSETLRLLRVALTDGFSLFSLLLPSSPSSLILPHVVIPSGVLQTLLPGPNLSFSVFPRIALETQYPPVRILNCAGGRHQTWSITPAQRRVSALLPPPAVLPAGIYANRPLNASYMSCHSTASAPTSGNTPSAPEEKYRYEAFDLLMRFSCSTT